MSFRNLQRMGVLVGAGVLAVATAGPAAAHQCTNPDKKPAAGVQITFGDEGPVWISDGLQKRIDAGLVNLEDGEGFHGLIGFDIDGDTVADATIYIVGPDGEISETAQTRGAPCHGIINIEALFSCLG